MSPLSTDPEEWIEQAEHDLKAAEFLSKSGYRYYAIFLCHLSVEKALKGLYFKTLKIIPPKTHNLSFLIDRIGISPPDNILRSILTLNEAHIATRYPDEFKTMQRIYSKNKVEGIISISKETIKWIKNKF